MKIILELNNAYLLDATEGTKLIKSNSIRLAILDPPYGKIVKTDWDKNNKAFNIDLINELFRVITDDGNLYIWCGIGEKSQSLIDFYNVMNQSKFHFKEMIVWKKQRGNGGRKGWLQTHELVLWYTKVKTTNFIWNKNEQYSDEKRPWNVYKKGGEMVNKSEYKRLTNVWSDINEVGYGGSPKTFKINKDKINHLTPKPDDSYERIIKAHTLPGDIILDTFIGSGTLKRAANNIGDRKWRYMDG